MTKMGKAAGVCVCGAAHGRAFTLVVMPTHLVTKEHGQNTLVW